MDANPLVRTVAASAGGVLAEIYREGEVLTREEGGTSIRLTARLPAGALGRLRTRDGVAVVESPAA